MFVEVCESLTPGEKRPREWWERPICACMYPRFHVLSLAPRRHQCIPASFRESASRGLRLVFTNSLGYRAADAVGTAPDTGAGPETYICMCIELNIIIATPYASVVLYPAAFQSVNSKFKS